MTTSRILACAAALVVASTATPALAAGDNPPPGLLAKIQVATQALPGPDALTELPAPPKLAAPKVNPGPPNNKILGAAPSPSSAPQTSTSKFRTTALWGVRQR
jgi:hypothetical protein